MNNISLLQVNSKKPTSYDILADVWAVFLAHVPKEYMRSDIAKYLEGFIEKQSVKDRISLDDMLYYVIFENEQKLGLVECTNRKDETLCELYILEEYKTAQNYLRVLNCLEKELNKKLKFIVNKNFKKDVEIFLELNFKSISNRIKYIGSNYFMPEEIMQK